MAKPQNMTRKRTVVKEVDTSNDTPLMTLFRQYSKKLDEKNDKYERIYKTNRDITQKSKRVIFSLQRIAGICEEEQIKLLNNGRNELRDIEQTLIKYIAMELHDEQHYQFINAYTGGIQEYIEAVTFLGYLENQRLVSHSTIQKKVTFGDIEETAIVPLNVAVSPLDYMLGLSDLTGELMRYCIKCESIGEFTKCKQICDVMRQINGRFIAMGYIQSKGLFSKMSTLQSSVKKVEDVCYSLQLRKLEIPDEVVHSIKPFSLLDNED